MTVGIAVFHFQGIDRRVVEKGFQAFRRRFIFRSPVPLGQITCIKVRLFIRQPWRTNGHLQMGVRPPVASLRFAGRKTIRRHPQRNALPTASADGLIKELAAASKAAAHEAIKGRPIHSPGQETLHLGVAIRQINTRVFRQNRQRHLHRRRPGGIVARRDLRLVFCVWCFDVHGVLNRHSLFSKPKTRNTKHKTRL